MVNNFCPQSGFSWHNLHKICHQSWVKWPFQGYIPPKKIRPVLSKFSLIDILRSSDLLAHGNFMNMMTSCIVYRKQLTMVLIRLWGIVSALKIVNFISLVY